MRIHLGEKFTEVTSPEKVHNILQELLKVEPPEDQDKEHFWVFMLTRRNTIKALDLVALGLIDSAPVHPREVFTRAVATRCAAIIVAHNHPSGIPEPSSEDREATNRLVAAGGVLGIEVIDHVITSSEGYKSFKQEGFI